MSDTFRHAELQWDEDGQPVSREFGDVYFSKANGLEETRHVFLQHNQLAERFSLLTDSGALFSIGETGFGSGLNFLACWQLWRETAPPDARLHFISAEKYPLSINDLQKSLTLWPALAELVDELVNTYPGYLYPGFHRLQFDQGRVQLTLMIGDAADMFSQVSTSRFPPQEKSIDAWFLDGFAPTKNPDMWSDELFQAIHRLSGEHTTAATFSSAGIVKRGLRHAGFTVKKVAGFGRKREMVKAVFTAASAESEFLIDAAVTIKDQSEIKNSLPAWCRSDQPTDYKERTVLIIGGGLAGCHTARALADRGWQVTIVEREAHLAAGGSGNPQGIVYARLSPKLETQASFNLGCLQFALRHYAPFWKKPRIGNACGVLQLAHNDAEKAWQESLLPQFSTAQALVQFVDPGQASALAGVGLQYGGLYFPTAGWINPRALCETLTRHDHIRIITAQNVSALTRNNTHWHVMVDTKEELSALVAEVVVIANADDARTFEQSAHLPLKAIRGQTTLFAESTRSKGIRSVICADGYLSPAIRSGNLPACHCAGATFSINDRDKNPRAEDHQKNLANINHVLAEEHAVNTDDIIDGRVCFRCATPDYLPVVGQLPQFDAFLEDYAVFRKDARANVATAGRYWPGLFVNAGHGSRGLTYTPLCAELLASQINGEPLPVDTGLVQALNPSRFIIRNLKRKRL